ncbi:MAG: RluA family pseudouridine synthase [Oligosphaeraceae bacterium]
MNQPQVLYLDNHLLVLDKPWGMLTQPSGTRESSLEEWGKAYLKERFQKPGNVFLEAVHRIDRVVGGVVLFARTSKALSRLNACQRSHGIRKEYQGLVWRGGTRLEGTPFARESGELRTWLVHEEHFARVAASPKEPGARECVLGFARQRVWEEGILLKLELQTGRYHQIRAQLAASGFPLCGDVKYGAPPESRAGFPNFREGIGLLSRAIEFSHPVLREQIAVESRLSLTEPPEA